MNDVSPELALVDDVLAQRERARLPEPGDCLAPPAPLAPTSALTRVASSPEPAGAESAVAPASGAGMLPTLALAQPPGDPAAEAVGVGAVEDPVALVQPVDVAEPALEVEPPSAEAAEELVTEETEDEAIDVAAAEGPPAPAEPEPPAEVEPPAVPEREPEREVELPSAEIEEAPAEPERVGPGRMPDWVASDQPPTSRRTSRKDRALARRHARGDEQRPMRRRVAVAASWVVLCGFLASPLLAFIPSPDGERPTLAPDGVGAVPEPGEAAGHVLRWEPVPKAAGYSVVFVDDGVRSDRWSQTARLRLPAGTGAEQLVTYEWFAYPAFRDGAGYRYGPLVASGEVTMPRLAPTEGG